MPFWSNCGDGRIPALDGGSFFFAALRVIASPSLLSTVVFRIVVPFVLVNFCLDSPMGIGVLSYELVADAMHGTKMNRSRWISFKFLT